MHFEIFFQCFASRSDSEQVEKMQVTFSNLERDINKLFKRQDTCKSWATLCLFNICYRMTLTQAKQAVFSYSTFLYK